MRFPPSFSVFIFCLGYCSLQHHGSLGLTETVGGRGTSWYMKPLRLETDGSKALNPQALCLGDFRVLFLFKGSPPQQDQRWAGPV